MGTLNMIQYLTKVKSCCDILAIAGHRVTEEDQILYVLTSLGNEYDLAVVTITSTYTLRDVGAILLSFETRLERNSTVIIDEACHI